MYQRAGAGSTFPQIFIGQTHVGGCNELYALDRAGKLDGLLAGERRAHEHRATLSPPPWCRCAPGFCPSRTWSRASRLIREAEAQGADYVQTPEVSNMMQVNRKALFEHLATEEDDKSLKAYRELAKELRIYLHVGSLALQIFGGEGGQPLVPDRAGRRHRSRSYDKIHMFDIDLPGGESYRELANYQPGETAVISDLPWGRIGLTICYDVRFPALYRALAESGASFLTVPSAFTKKTGEAHWHVLLRSRAIENGCFVFAAAQAGTAREQARDVRPFADRRPLGRNPCRRAASSPASSWPRSIRRRSRPRERPFRRCSMAAALASPIPRPARSICTWCGARHDPLQPALRARTTRSRAGSRARRPMTSRSSASS